MDVFAVHDALSSLVFCDLARANFSAVVFKSTGSNIRMRSDTVLGCIHDILHKIQFSQLIKQLYL